MGGLHVAHLLQPYLTSEVFPGLRVQVLSLVESDLALFERCQLHGLLRRGLNGCGLIRCAVAHLGLGRLDISGLKDV